jgi:hypothetical protein
MWPRGLQIIFWLVTFNLVGGIITPVYKCAVVRDLSYLPGNMPQWILLGASYVVQGAAVISGMRRLRSAFVRSTLAAITLSLLLAVWFNLEISMAFSADVLRGDGGKWIRAGETAAVYFWNAFVIALDVLICAYLVGYELFARHRVSSHVT